MPAPPPYHSPTSYGFTDGSSWDDSASRAVGTDCVRDIEMLRPIKTVVSCAVRPTVSSLPSRTAIRGATRANSPRLSRQGSATEYVVATRLPPETMPAGDGTPAELKRSLEAVGGGKRQTNQATRDSQKPGWSSPSVALTDTMSCAPVDTAGPAILEKPPPKRQARISCSRLRSHPAPPMHA